MSDLINGREMLKRYQEDLCYDIACKDCSMCTEDGGCRVEEWIDKFPSADRPQGMWELVPCTGLSEYFEGVKHGFRYRCSNCKDERRRNKLENFCPHCGARMKGADDEESM